MPPQPQEGLVAAADAGIESICFTPATGLIPESACPHRKGCGYIDQFADTPALRILPHARLKLRQPNDLPLPPDLVVIDEAAIGALVETKIVDPALLTDRGTYAADFGEGYRVEKAMETGRAVVKAMTGEVDP